MSPVRSYRAQPAACRGGLVSPEHGTARGATLRRQVVTVPAGLGRPQRRTTLDLPEHWPWAKAWLRLWQQVFTPGLAAPSPA